MAKNRIVKPSIKLPSFKKPQDIKHLTVPANPLAPVSAGRLEPTLPQSSPAVGASNIDAQNQPNVQNTPEPSGPVLGSMKKGGKISKTGTYKLHKDEVVIPAPKAKTTAPKVIEPEVRRVETPAQADKRNKSPRFSW